MQWQTYHASFIRIQSVSFSPNSVFAQPMESIRGDGGSNFYSQLPLLVWRKNYKKEWLLAAQYLLTSSALAKDTTKAVRDHSDTKHEQEDGYKQFSRRMNDVFNSYGDVIPSQWRINMNTEGRDPAINSLLQRFCDIHEGCAYMEVVLQAKSEWAAFRARTEHTSRAPVGQKKFLSKLFKIIYRNVCTINFEDYVLNHL